MYIYVSFLPLQYTNPTPNRCDSFNMGNRCCSSASIHTEGHTRVHKKYAASGARSKNPNAATTTADKYAIGAGLKKPTGSTVPATITTTTKENHSKGDLTVTNLADVSLDISVLFLFYDLID